MYAHDFLIKVLLLVLFQEKNYENKNYFTAPSVMPWMICFCARK